MPSPQRLLSLCGALLFGLAVGWTAGELIPKRKSSGVTALKTNFAGDSQITNRRDFADNAGSAKSTAPLSAKSPEFLHELRAALNLNDNTEVLIRLQELVDALAPADFPAAYLAARKFDDAERFLIILGGRWAKMDAPGAAAFGATHEAPQNYLAGVGAEWARRDLKGAIAWLDTTLPQPGHGDLTFLVLNVIGMLGKDDPRAALELWSRQKKYVADWVKEDEANGIYAQWVNLDPQAAVTAALEARDNGQPDALTTVVKAWTEKDAAAAEAWISQLPSGATRKILARQAGQALLAKDPAAAIAWAASCRDPYVQQSIFKMAFPSYAQSDLSAALQALAGLPPGQMRNAVISDAMWAVSQNGDSNVALQLFDQLPAGPERDRAASSISASMGAADPRAALDWLLAHASLSGNGGGGGTLRAWLAKSPDEAISWVQALPSGENRDAALSAVAETCITKDPAQAKALFQQLSPDGQQQAARPMIKQLFIQDPDQARQWAETLRPGNAQATAFGYVAGEWYKQDPAAAARWLNTLPNGQGRDSAVAAYSDALCQKDPAGAMTYALSIADELDRNSEIDSLARNWMYRDSPAARQWIADSRLSAEQKTHLLNRGP